MAGCASDQARGTGQQGAPGNDRRGHLLPVIATPGQPAAPARIARDLPVGAASQHPHQVISLGFPPGAVLCLYTDGLVERRDQPIDEGITRLAAAVTVGDPGAGCTEPTPPKWASCWQP